MKANGWVLGIFGLLFYVGGSELRKFENRAAAEIRSKLQGEESRVTVRSKLSGRLDNLFGDFSRVTIQASNFSTEGLPLFTEPGRSQRGRIGRLDLKLSEFALGNLHIERLEAQIPECRFDLPLAMGEQKIRLSKSGVGDGSVRIRAKDLEAFILKKFREIKRVQVRIEDGFVNVEGYGEFLIVKTDFAVRAKLEPVDGSKLVLSESVIKFGDQIADETSKKVLLDTLNPVVDLNRDLRLHGAIEVRDIRLTDGYIQASGATRIPELPH